MRFEKLNEDKIRITLSHDDLLKKDIDFHSFMADSIESQDLFSDCLKEAEKQIGFVTKNYILRIEALAMSSGDFVLTVTRSLPQKQKYNNKKYYYKKRFSNIYNNKCKTNFVYSFESFDDYCNFIIFLDNNNFKIYNIADYILLYEYKNTYYLVFKNMNFENIAFKRIFYCITDFASLVNNSDIFINKFAENR